MFSLIFAELDLLLWRLLCLIVGGGRGSKVIFRYWLFLEVRRGSKVVLDIVAIAFSSLDFGVRDLLGLLVYSRFGNATDRCAVLNGVMSVPLPGVTDHLLHGFNSTTFRKQDLGEVDSGDVSLENVDEDCQLYMQVRLCPVVQPSMTDLLGFCPALVVTRGRSHVGCCSFAPLVDVFVTSVGSDVFWF